MIVGLIPEYIDSSDGTDGSSESYVDREDRSKRARRLMVLFRGFVAIPSKPVFGLSSIGAPEYKAHCRMQYVTPYGYSIVSIS